MFASASESFTAEIPIIWVFQLWNSPKEAEAKINEIPAVSS